MMRCLQNCRQKFLYAVQRQNPKALPLKTKKKKKEKASSFDVLFKINPHINSHNSQILSGWFSALLSVSNT